MRRTWMVGALALVAVVAVGCPVEPGGADGGGTTTTVPAAACPTMVEVSLASGLGQRAKVSADGGDLVYLVGSEVRHLDLVTGAETTVTGDIPSDLPLWGIQIRPDGDRAVVIASSRAFMIDLVTDRATELDWSGIVPPGFFFELHFSGDLSVYVAQFPSGQYTIIPTDGSPVRTVPALDGEPEVNLDGTTIAGRTKVLRNGQVLTFPQPLGFFSGIVGVNRAGSVVQVAVDGGGGVLWSPDTGAIEPIALPGADPGSGAYGAFTDDGRVYVGYVEVDGEPMMARIDRSTGAVLELTQNIDGVTSISDDGTVFTSTVSPFFRCAG